MFNYLLLVLTLFTSKSLAQGGEDTYLCKLSSSLFLEKTPYILNTLNQLLCVDGNNSQSMYKYRENLLDGKNLNSIEEFLDKETNRIEVETSANSLGSASYFTNSDNVWILKSNNRLGYLLLPSQINGDTKCSYNTGIRYMEDKTTKCIPTPVSINAECSNNLLTSLSLKYFLNDFKIIRRPKALNECYIQSGNTGSIQYYDKCSSDFILTVSLRKCTFNDGTVDQNCVDKLKDILTPTSTGNQCKNLVKSIKYLLKYNNPLGLIEAALDVEFFDVTLPSVTSNIEQNFNVIFVQNFDNSPLKSYADSDALSGNPGYQSGQPIQAGPDRPTPLVADRNKRFTYLKASNTGDCPSDDTIRETIRFKYDASTQCYKSIEIDAPLDKSKCNNIQKELNNIILGFDQKSQPFYFAEFATSTNRSKWKEIKEASPNFDALYNKNKCTLNVGTDLIIAYALVGNTRNPQAKIVYVTYKWNENKDIEFKCDDTTKKCRAKTLIKARITFVNITQEAIFTESKLELAASYLPIDFFYPFSRSSFILPNYKLVFIVLSFIVVKLF